MTMTTTQAISTIAAVVLGTMATRFIPFIIFPEGKNPPEFIKYLGTVLPYAAIGHCPVYGTDPDRFSLNFFAQTKKLGIDRTFCVRSIPSFVFTQQSH